MRNLDKYKFSTKEGFNSVLLKLRYKELSKYFIGNFCLEMGCADGEGTKLLLPYFKNIVAIDGSKRLISKVKKDIKKSKVVFVHSFFEDFKSEKKFDTIVLAHILEHVNDPIKVLKIAKKCLAKNGVIIIDVPNAMSLHRQAGVLMDMIQNEHSLNGADLSIGHQRVYDFDLLRKDVAMSGLKITKEGGLFMKPFSNKQMEKILTKKGIDAFNEIGKKYPNIAAEIFVICKS